METPKQRMERGVTNTINTTNHFILRTVAFLSFQCATALFNSTFSNIVYLIVALHARFFSTTQAHSRLSCLCGAQWHSYSANVAFHLANFIVVLVFLLRLLKLRRSVLLLSAHLPSPPAYSAAYDVYFDKLVRGIKILAAAFVFISFVSLLSLALICDV